MVEFKAKLNNNKNYVFAKFPLRILSGVIIIIFSLTFLILGFNSILNKTFDQDIISGIILIVLAVLFAPLCFLVCNYFYKKNYKNAIYEAIEIYTLDDEYLTITQAKGNLFQTIVKAKYTDLYGVIEDNNYFYLYISKMQYHIINKSSITHGSLEEARTILKNNLKDKFKRK